MVVQALTTKITDCFLRLWIPIASESQEALKLGLQISKFDVQLYFVPRAQCEHSSFDNFSGIADCSLRLWIPLALESNEALRLGLQISKLDVQISFVSCADYDPSSFDNFSRIADCLLRLRIPIASESHEALRLGLQISKLDVQIFRKSPTVY